MLQDSHCIDHCNLVYDFNRAFNDVQRDLFDIFDYVIYKAYSGD